MGRPSLVTSCCAPADTCCCTAVAAGMAPNSDSVEAGAPKSEGVDAAPNSDGALVPAEAPPNSDGVLLAPNGDGVLLPKPKAGVGCGVPSAGVDVCAPNSEGVDAGPEEKENAGVLTAAPGVAPNAGADDAPKSEPLEAGAEAPPKLKPLLLAAGAPNAGTGAAPNKEVDTRGAPKAGMEAC